MAIAGSIKGVVGRGFGFSSAIGLVVTAGFGSSTVIIISGPFDVVAAQVFVAGATASEVFNAGAAKAEVFNAGAVESEVVV